MLVRFECLECLRKIFWYDKLLFLNIEIIKQIVSKNVF